jgi:hypothetical protein
MASNVVSRKTSREALGILIDAAFDTTWDVFNYKVTKFSNKAKNIVVTSAGSKRTIEGARSIESDSSFRFRVFVFVLFSSPLENWTPQNSDDEIDVAEKKIADVCNDNQETSNWNRLYFEGETDPDLIVDEGGQTFRREIITVRVEKRA